jgi:hypothetical protein
MYAYIYICRVSVQFGCRLKHCYQTQYYQMKRAADSDGDASECGDYVMTRPAAKAPKGTSASTWRRSNSDASSHVLASVTLPQKACAFCLKPQLSKAIGSRRIR